MKTIKRYYSEVLNKEFNTEADCLQAEKRYEEKLNKEKLAQQKKNEAKKRVDEAEKKLLAAEKEYNDAVKAYLGEDRYKQLEKLVEKASKWDLDFKDFDGLFAPTSKFFF